MSLSIFTLFLLILFGFFSSNFVFLKVNTLNHCSTHLFPSRLSNLIVDQWGYKHYATKYNSPHRKWSKWALQFECNCSTIEKVSYNRAFIIPNINGLCNRLSVLSGIIYLSNRDRIPILISSTMMWKQLWNLTEQFPNQFIEVSDQQIYCLSNFTVHYAVYFNYRDVKTYDALIRAFKVGSDQLFYTNYSVITGNTVTIKWHELNEENKFNTGAVFTTLGIMMRKLLIPTDKLKKKMKLIYPRYEVDQYTGIHIRCGGVLCDSKGVGEFLPPNACYDFLMTAINTTGIRYIALDSKKMKDILFNKTISNIVINPKDIRNVDSKLNSPTSVVNYLFESVAELMILGNSESCLGTYKSTFSTIACSLSRGREKSLFYHPHYKLISPSKILL